MAESSEQRNAGKRVWIVTGESSGDLYGARLASALQNADPGVTVQGMGGPKMAAAGVDILIDASHMGVVGFVEVIKHIGMFRRCLYDLREKAQELQPDVVVLIDFPGFNLRLAQYLHDLSLKVVYYVSPQVWAWRRGRVHKIAQVVDRMLVIFPFEKDAYKDTSLPVTFVGHPLVGFMNEQKQPGIKRDPHTILLLPGSRSSEVKRVFPILLQTARCLQQRHDNLRFIVPLPSPELIAAAEMQWQNFARKNKEISLAIDIREGKDMTHWMQTATCGVAASGTVTMEAAIMGLPLVVVYRLHPVTYWLGRILVKVPYVTIVNLIAGTMVFEEFLQGDARPQRVAQAVESVLPGGDRREEVETYMADVVDKLGGQRNVDARVASIVLST